MRYGIYGMIIQKVCGPYALAGIQQNVVDMLLKIVYGPYT